MCLKGGNVTGVIVFQNQAALVAKRLGLLLFATADEVIQQ